MVPAYSYVSVLQCILCKGRNSFIINIDVIVTCTKQFCIFRGNPNILEYFGKLFVYRRTMHYYYSESGLK